MVANFLDDFTKFWQRCNLTKPPFVHPDDCEVLRTYGERYVGDDYTDFAEFVLSRRFGDFTDRRFHLSLLPSPYCGNLQDADILVLLLNPGFSLTDYHAELRVPKFRSRLEQTLAQNLSDLEFPFVFLDPEHCWHGGFRWWEEKLRDIITIIARKKFNGKYHDALRHISKRLASLELIPYHSSSFNAHRLIKELPSVRAVRRFAQDALAKTVSGRDRTIIVTRQVSSWGLTGCPPNLICYEKGQTQGASLGPNSPGGRAILDRCLSGP